MKTLDRLIEILCAERNEAVPNLSEEQKPNFFRALCNVRPPKPASAEFLRLQDQYLSEQTALRGVTDVDSLNFVDNIALWQGDIITLNADAVVNACNSALLGCFQPLHNCIDNRIHSFAGVQVRLDCNDLMKGKTEPNGKVRVTKAYNLPCRYIFHTVGPQVWGRVTAQNKADLASCYVSCFDKAAEMGLNSIAFCCISTGVFGYPKADACEVAVDTVKSRLSACAQMDTNIRIVFNVFTDQDKQCYEKKLHNAFSNR